GTTDDFTVRNQLHVPVGRPIVVHLSSEDVIHSFFVPVFRVKQDAVPGMDIKAWFQATVPGQYELGCAELCGMGHYRMRAQVFFAIMPLLVGVYVNFLIPLKIGAHDMAFPRINMASFWAAFAAGLLMFASLFVPEGAIRSGWTNYAPLSARPDLSGVTTGQI